MIRGSKSVLANSFRYTAMKQLKRENELNIAKKLKQALSPTFLSVHDTTLGVNSCGKMYKIIIESPTFKEKSKVEQHQLVAEALSQEMKTIHGFNLKTRIPFEQPEPKQQNQERQSMI